MKIIYAGSQFPQDLCYGSPKAARDPQKPAVLPSSCPCPPRPETAFPIVSLVLLVLQQEVLNNKPGASFHLLSGKGLKVFFRSASLFIGASFLILSSGSKPNPHSHLIFGAVADPEELGLH